MSEELPGWAVYTMGVGSLGYFGLFLGGLVVVGRPPAPGPGLAVLAAAVGAVGGVLLLILDRRGVAGSRQRLAALSIGPCFGISVVLWTLPAVDVPAFRLAFLVLGTVVLTLLGLVLAVAGLGPEGIPWTDGTVAAGDETNR